MEYSSDEYAKWTPRKHNVFSCMPLYMAHAVGRSKATQVVNLSSNFQKIIAISCSHAIVMFDYESQKPYFLQGHKNVIASISCDRLGKWLVTSDSGPDSIMIVWSMATLCPTYTFKLPDKTYMTKMSPCGRCILSVSSNENYSSCAVWVLREGSRDPNGTYEFNVNLGIVKHVAFSCDSSTNFMLTTSKAVLFFTWRYDAPEPENPDVCIPTLHLNKCIGQLSESIFLQGLSRCVTSTHTGTMLFWNNDMNSPHDDADPSSQPKKVLEKWYYLQSDGITSLRQLNQFIITGDKTGTIRFYDSDLCLLYWIQNSVIPENITQIEFHLQPRFDFDDTESQKSEIAIAKDKRSNYFLRNGQQKFRVSSEPPGTAADKASLLDSREGRIDSKIQDFIVVDGHGCVYLIDFLDNKCCNIYETQMAEITSIDVHPERSLITLGDKSGSLGMVNYDNGQYIYRRSVSEFLKAKDVTISCIQYTTKGNHLAVGTVSGELFFVDSCLYYPVQKNPFHVSLTKISRICFSPDDTFMAHIDDKNCVTLYGSYLKQNEVKAEQKWIYCGRICSHYDAISCLTFDPSPLKANRLLSIGYDHALVEYVLEIREGSGLGIMTKDRIEQTACPTSISWSTDSLDERCIIITNSEFKYKIYDYESKNYRQTIQGPVYDSPISFCQMLKQYNGEKIMVFATDKCIGLQKLPLDGNPYKVVGVIAHPEKLAAVVLSSDSEAIFTLGMNETAIIKWYQNLSALETLHDQGGAGLEPFQCMMDGGADHWLFQQAVDYVYLGQLLHEGRLWQDEHIITCNVKACELIYIMCSLGYFPTGCEIESMLSEVFSGIASNQNKEGNEIEFEDFIRLFINHRPANGIYFNQLASHFDILRGDKESIAKEKFLTILQQEGEKMTADDMSVCLHILFQEMDLNEKEHYGSTKIMHASIPQELTQNIIEDALLGLNYIKNGK